MESRDAQDAGAVRRSGAFSGRQVPLEMGTLRVGGSGRPVPAVFSAAASRRSVTSSLDAAAAPSIAISPRLTLERHPRSPFRRREELSKTVVRSRDDSSRSRFQVKKIQIRRTGRKTIGSDAAARSHETRTSRSSEVVVAHDGQSQQLEQNGEQTQQRGKEDLDVVRTGREELAFQVGERLSDVAATPRRESPTHFIEEKPHSSERRTRELRSRALPLAASSTLGTYVSSTPSLTKLRSSFTARELALFTHRQDNADSDVRSQARYHVASHPHSTTVTTPPAALETNQERSREKPSGHKRTGSSVTFRRDPEHIPGASGKRNVESSWTRVDTSIDHIYDDPAIDMLQMHLLHSHHTTSGQKKRKMVERERVLSAASGLREQQFETKRQQEQIQQRKLQVQKMSEAIRQQNQRAVRAKAVHSAGVNGRRPKSSQRADSAPNLPERKPPVPRLSRNGTTPKQLKRKKKPKDDSRLQGVSTSILMGLPSDSSRDVSHQELATDGEGEGAKEEEEDGRVIRDEASKPPVKQQTAKRRPPATTPRVSKREKRSTKPPENDAAIRAKEVRRAIAREYMQLQKNSRRIWNAKVKEQSQREQEKRQQQLEILEATRLKKLRLAKKRANNRKKQELVDPVLPEDDAMVTIAMSISPRSSLTPYDNAIDTPLKRENMEKVRKGDEEISFDEPHLDDENDRAIGNRKVSEHRSTNFDTSPFRSAEQVENVEVGRDEKRVAQTSERVQKLLELREKAAALSARLSGLRKQQGASTEVLATEPESKSGPSTNDVSRSASDAHSLETATDIPATDVVNQPDLSTIHVAKSSTRDVLGLETLPDNPAADAMDRDGASESSSDNEIGEDAEGNRITGNESGDEFDDRRSGSSDVDREGHDVMESRNSSSVSEENEDSLDGSHEDQKSEAAASPVASSQQIVQQTRAFNAASATLDEDIDIDIRSIGVYNIGVVWPLNTEEATEAKSEAKLSSASVQADSSSSSSSGSSSTTNSPRGLQWLLLAGQLEDSHDESRDDSEGAYEVAFYEQLKGRLQRPTIESKAAPSLSYREERGKDAMSALESDSDVPYSPARSLQSGLSPVNGTSPVLTNQPRQPNEGLMRLIRETDDSLSVVDRAAKALYQEQVERLEREKEKELQIRIEAEKKALLEKDLALKAVMESLTGKIAHDDDSDVGDSDDGSGSHSEDDAADVQDAQYKRLEEIMDEVERERARENGDTRTSSFDRGLTLDREQTTNPPSEENLRKRGGIPVSTSPSIFWDQLVSDSAPRELDGEHLNVARPHVAVDDSELAAQREARLRKEDERKAGYDSPPRVHSPRTLSKRLMAAVDYQEAIFEAHMQLAMMEHAHELETVQAETITLAQTFKEEMENNATTHQLALDHATLEKKFDDDMQDVMQQLTTIREAEEQERVAHESQLEQQLRQANLRECSVQTETSQRADAATSAALYVDTSTSPVRFVSDAAVQASPPVNSERGCGDAVEDDVAASEYSEESESDGDIDEADAQLASAVEAISENALGEQYSSQFEDTSRGNSMSAIPTKRRVGDIPSDDEISEIVATASGHNDEDDNAGITAVSEELHYSDDAFESGQVEETEVSYSEHLQQSDIGEDVASSIDEEEEIIVDAHDTSGGKADSENYEAEYENDYENASFDEAQPASEVYSEDAPASVDDYPEDEVAPSIGEEEEEIIVEHEATEGMADSDNYEAEYENDYESASFDETQSTTGAPSEDASPPIEEYPDGEIAPSVGEEEEEEGIIIDEHESSEGNAESGDYEDEYENDYENASFDEAQSATDVPSDDVRGSIEEYPEAEVAPSVGDEEEEIIAEHETSKGKAESDNYEAEYENDYESASFDEAQSATDIPSEDASPPIEEDAVAPIVDEEEEEAIDDEHQTSGGKAESIKDEAEYENDYEDASFDGAQSTTEIPSDDVRDSVERHPGDDVVPSIDEEEAGFIDEKEDEVDTYEAENENDYESESFEAQPTTELPSEDAPPPDQALSDAGENPSEIGDDIVPSSIDEEEEGNVIDEQETSEGNVRSDGDNYEEEYENDYENESFDEVQSTTNVPPDDAPGPLEEYYAEAGTMGEDAHENAGQHDEDDDTNAYSDEGFDSASGSFASEAPPPATASHAPGSPHDSNLAASTSVKEEELTQAIEVVAGQIQEDEPADELSIVQAEQTASVQCAAEDSKSMLTSVSISASHDGEEEVLTKSIEERMTRLEALRQKIADRKGEILGVQKQMRVEKRREQVVAEEKLLWDEMEAVEKLLRADEAALALCKQRNRLEIMNLEARQLTHASRTENEVGNERPVDLLSGYDYVEEACVDEVQKHSLGETMMARLRPERGFDLLEGYVYIEDAEPVECHTVERILPAPAPTIAEPDGDDEDLSGVNSDDVENDAADSESENGDQDQAQDMVAAEDSMQEEVVSDLLNGYNYVEDADPVDRDTNVSAPPAAVPSMEAPDHECEGESEANNVAVASDAAGNGPEICDHSQDVASSEGSVREQTALDLLDDYNYIEDVEPVACDVDEPILYVAVPCKTEPDGESEASCGDSKPDEQNVEPSVEALSNGPPEVTPREDNEHDRAAKGERLTDEVFASIFDDIINSELQIWSRRRLAASTHSTSSREETVIRTNISTAIATAKLGNSVEPVKQVADEASKEKALNPTQELEERLETVKDELRFPVLPDDLIPQDVVTEASELPVTPEQSERELEQQVQMLPDEASAEDLRDDVLVSQNCSTSNVGNIVSEMQSELHDVAVSERFGREQVFIDLLGEYNYVEDAEPADCNVDEPMVPIAVLRKTEPDDEVTILYEDAEANNQNILPIAEELPSASSEATPGGDNELDRAAESERMTDEIFASFFDDIINSELRIWSRRRLAASAQRSPQHSVANFNASTTTIPARVGNFPKNEKREADEASRGRDLNVTQQLVERLEIVNGELRLPVLQEITTASASPAARVLYDTVETLAQDCFNAIQQTTTGEAPLDQTSVLQVIQQHVDTEVRELLAIREQSERELERQVQLLSDETGAEGLNSDVLLSQNCIASNVSSIVSKVQSDLSRTTEDLSTAAQPSRSGIFSRTPVSRARNTSILSSLQTQQDQELQQRLTGLILSDLLHDAGLP